MKLPFRRLFSGERLPLSRALLWIFMSTLIVSGSTTIGILYLEHVKELRSQNPQYRVLAIIQSSPEKETLQTVYLAELLHLSIDQPMNLYRFDSREAVNKLLACPLIKEATIKKIKPGMLYIDYTMRKPIAYLGDYQNAAVDKDGFLFPFKPFFTPKKIPEIYLGTNQPGELALEEFNWGSCIKDERFDLALSLYEHLEAEGYASSSIIKKIDVSKAYEPSYGQRQIILVLENQVEREVNGQSYFYSFPRILRLDPEKYVDGLARWRVLFHYLQKNELETPLNEMKLVMSGPEKVIDLRLPDLAYITTSR